jgi:hypothetical protein
MPQNTNLNISPYFDDFDRFNNYNRVLFKPSTPIQARELTTLQTILQDQIEQFGKHFFKEGSIVIPGQIAYDPEYTSVKIEDSHLGIPVSTYIDKFLGKLIKGETSGVTAKVENYITPENGVDYYTLFVKYQSSSDLNFTTNTFIDGETLISLENIDYSLSSIRVNTSFASSIITNSTSVGSAAKIAEGVYFIRGFFITVSPQTVILDEYTNNPSYRVGLLIDEEIVIASNAYNDLFDNAQGFSNYAAPGADRLKISATLIKKSLNDFNDENFIELLRVEDGILQKFVKETNYNIIREELARRTYDESGDYYIRPFNVSLSESLNNKLGNNGIYNSNQQTKQGNTPSEGVACLSISPGKAYVRGYEIETISNTQLDIDKPRTTDTEINESIPVSIGRQILVNNVYGSIPVGVGTTSLVKLYSDRTSSVGVSSGSQIGVARVYDLKLKNSQYENAATKFELSLYDIQTYTRITLNSDLTQNIPAFIQGKNSAASGYLVSNTSSNTVSLYQVSGSFIVGEQIKINGVDNGRTIILLRDYNLSDVHQFVGNESTGIGTFTADPILSNTIFLSDPSAQYTISAASSGISTVTTSNQNFYVGIQTGDIVSYTKQGDSLPTYNKVVLINSTNKSIILSPTSSISGVSVGTLPVSATTANDFKKVTLDVLNTSSAFLYSTLKQNNISNLDLTNSNIIIKKSYTINITSNSFSGNFGFNDVNYTLEPFDEEDYNLTYVSTGLVEPLNNQKLTISGRTLTLSNLSVSSGQAVVTVTYRKINTSTRKKVYNRCSSIIINNTVSGVNTTSSGLGLSSVYGLRVEDPQISLNISDVESVIGIYESSNTNDPALPSSSLINLNSNILNSIIGEYIVGSTSNAVATLVSRASDNNIEFVYLNENVFNVGESVTFQESQIVATISSVNIGDKNIKDSYTLDTGHRSEYLDFSRIIRKKDATAPTKKLKIIFNFYSINNSDGGDFVAVNSYDKDRYSFNIPVVDGIRATDIIDLRPRVLPYSGTRSPFEFESRIFSSQNNSTPFTFSKDKSINLSYSYYLGRIDKLYVTKEGTFTINKGIPSLTPKLPDVLESGLEIATVYLPAYLYNVKDANIIFATHKRYTMKDISRIEDRLSNVEYYTSLSLLESDTRNLTIRDPQTKLDRFKSGFFVDNFKSVYGGEITNKSYKASIDTANGLLKPQHYTTSVDLLLGSESVIGIGITANPDADYRFISDLGSPNIKKVGDVVCLAYSDVEYVKNRFATRSENVNPFNTVNWIGSIELNPSSDTWIDTNKTEKTIDVEGSYASAIEQLGVDNNTGLSPIEWGSWETNWTGTSVAQGPVLGRLLQSSSIVSTTESVGQLQRGRGIPTNNRGGIGLGIPVDTTTSIKDNSTEFRNDTVTTTSNQSRSGIQYGVTSRYDSTRLGDRVVSREIITIMRSRNIEIISRRLKPATRFYSFFDDVDVTSYIIPKLIEITMTGGTFVPGETVIGSIGNRSIRFRLASQNHKYGPYNAATEIYTLNPYQPSDILPSTYSPTSSVLNVDTASLELQSASGFYGSISVNMQLIGQTSKAVAIINNLRLVTDSSGTLMASLFIPDPSAQSNPSFETGSKTLTLTTSSTNSTISGISESSAEAIFTSSGTLDNVEDSTLRIRNANIERNIKTSSRTVSETETRVVADTTFSDRSTKQRRWVDPLAQSFEVTDPNGLFLTKCDVYFRTKDLNNIPITLQIRTIQTGLPTQTILPFGEVILDSNKVNISDDASIPTTFTFTSPVFLETGNSYAIVLMSPSDSYNVWISRMGEIDISTVSKPDSDKIIISQQPTLGSLYKSQNGATWDPSQLEDLKFTLYRAEFTTSPASVRFYNPSLDIGNNQIITLRANAINAYSKSSLIGLGKSLAPADITSLPVGAAITQKNNSYFSGNLRSLVGAVGIGSTLIITNAGFGYTTSATYSNVNVSSLTGFGQGAKVNLTISNGVAVAATISSGGYGYAIGDSLTVNADQTGNFGKNLIISIPNTSGIITSFNSIIVDNIQGSLSSNVSDYIISNQIVINNANTILLQDITDGLHFKVNHKNHGMYGTNNYVQLSGIESDVPPQKLTSDYASTSNADINVNSVGIFTSFENYPVSANHLGYIKIGNEIISYTGCGTSTITGITRGATPGNYKSNELIFKYEFNGVSLKRINKTHLLSDVDLAKYPIELDSYHIKINTSLDGDDRSGDSVNYGPKLFFNNTKSGGSYQYITPQVNSQNGAKATQNIAFNIIKPNIQTLLPETTAIDAKVRTFSGTSVDGNEISFVDQGYETISLNSNNFLSGTRLIASQVNENNRLQTYPGKKSLTLEMTLSTKDSKVSPMIDLDRVNLITVMNRIDKPVSDFTLDSRVNQLFDDPNSAIYVSKTVRLEKSANGLKVLFDAYRHSTNEIKVMYKLLRNDTPDEQQLYELFPGYDNLDSNSNVINYSKNSGNSDRLINASTGSNDFRSYEYTANNLALFNGFQIKIIMTGTDQANIPNIKDLRVIATI